MKNLINSNFLKIIGLFFGLSFLSTNCNSQIYDWFKIYADEEGAPARFDHFSLNVFYNGWNHSISEIETKPLSIGFEIGLFKEIPLDKKGKISYAYGLTYSLNVIHHNAKFNTVSNSKDKFYMEISKETEEYKTNKFNTSFLEIPLEIRFRKIANPKIRFYPGFKAGLLLNMHTTRIDSESKIKTYHQKK